MHTSLRNSLPASGFALCDTAVAPTAIAASGGNSVLVDTPLVELDGERNARFDGPLPAACATEPDTAFLIRVGAGRWIANGTVLR